MKMIKIIIAVFAVLFVTGIIQLMWRTHRQGIIRAKEVFKTAITHNNSENKKTEVLTRCSDFLELNFPPSTKLLFACVTKGDFESPYVCSIKVQIDKKELAVFIEEINKHSEIKNHVLSNKVRTGLLNNFNFSHYNPNNVWQANKVKKQEMYTIIYNAECRVPVSTILIDLDNPENPIIYLAYARV